LLLFVSANCDNRPTKANGRGADKEKNMTALDGRQVIDHRPVLRATQAIIA
jgi:hypothetical protein